LIFYELITINHY